MLPKTKCTVYGWLHIAQNQVFDLWLAEWQSRLKIMKSDCAQGIRMIAFKDLIFTFTHGIRSLITVVAKTNQTN